MILRTLRMTAAVLLLAIAPDGRTALPDLDLAGNAHPAPWTAGGGTAALETTPEGLLLRIAGEDPQAWSPSVPIPSGGTHLLKLRLRSETAGEVQVFPFRDQPREDRSVRLQVPAFRWVDCCVPIDLEAGEWRFRVDPPGTNRTCTLARLWLEEPGTVGITGIEAVENSLVIHVAGVTGPVEIATLRPGDDLTGAAAARTVHTANADGPLEIRLPRFAFEGRERVDRLYRGFIARRPSRSPVAETLGSVHHVGSFRGVSRHDWPHPTPENKKGLQVQMTDDAIALGVRHAALNVDLPALADLNRASDSYTWELDGRTYHFRRAAVDAIPVRELSGAGAAVYLILLAYEPANAELRRLFLHPDYDRRAPNRLGAFNTVDPEGIAWMRATLEFLADRFSRPDQAHGRVAGYIVGNEVTAHWHWANMGPVSRDRFLEAYVSAARLVHTAVRTASAHARVYLSLDHHWNLVYGNDPLRAIAGRDLIDRFARLAAMGGDFDWHVAYHPYPENLFEPRTWKDRTALPEPGTPRITFRNLEVLTAYLGRPELRHRGAVRRVILSEQGFHSDGTPGGEAAQAAGYCYAWKKVNALPGIDAFILHRHVDHQHEGGLNLGLWRRKDGSVATPGTRKPIYEVFRAAGTPDEEEAFRFALPIIGIPEWSAMAP